MKFNLMIITFLLIFITGCGDNDKKSNVNLDVAVAQKSEIKQENLAQESSQETKKDEVKQDASKNEVQKKTVKKDETNSQALFELTLLDESKIRLQKFDKGFKVEGNDQAILFNFFATWCPPCKAEIPHLNNLQDKFRGKLKIISVLMEDKTKEEIEAFNKHYKVKFDVTYGASNFEFAKSLGGVIGIPYMVLYKPNGAYAFHYVGLVPEEMLESDILKVIN